MVCKGLCVLAGWVTVVMLAESCLIPDALGQGNAIRAACVALTFGEVQHVARQR